MLINTYKNTEKNVFSSAQSKPPPPPEKDDDAKKRPIQPSQTQCYKCNGQGHKAANCRAILKSCLLSLCGRQGHDAKNYRVSLKVNLPKPGGTSNPGIPAAPHNQGSAGCLVQSPQLDAPPEEVKSCIKGEQLLLACRKRILLLSNAFVEPLSGARSKIPVVKGRVDEKTVDILRDTGFSGIVVKKDLVSEEQYTGDFNCMLLIDNTMRKVPIAKITVDTPYLSGEVEAQCLSNAIYDLIVWM